MHPRGLNRQSGGAFDGPMRLRLVLALLAPFAAGCADPPAAVPVAAAPDSVVVRPYRLSTPDTVFALPAALREISGLTVLPSGRLAAIQDEDGLVFEIDPLTGTVVAETPFAAGGDFEGIEWAADTLWVLRSNGDLYRLARGEPVEVIPTPLSSRNDTEGLAWDAASRRLLIAAKEHPGGDLWGVRAVYAFDPATRRLSAAPVLVIDLAGVDTPLGGFKPSAIAVHPVSGEVYVLSSVRRAIAVLARDGSLLTVADFPPTILPQPEGLAFAPDGTLYVASEGGDGAGTLARFSPTAD